MGAFKGNETIILSPLTVREAIEHYLAHALAQPVSVKTVRVEAAQVDHDQANIVCPYLSVRFVQEDEDSVVPVASGVPYTGAS